ncbi:hypothetical protein GCM10027040_13290 [Halomonas shantousis]
MSTSSSVWSMPLAEFRDAIVSRAAPGCGAAAAAAADVGLALVMKGLRISQTRQHDARRTVLAEQAQALLHTLGRHADQDMAAFEDYLNATQLPRDSRAQQQERDRAVAEAAVRINAIPLATAETCLEALTLATEALPLTVASLRSDVVAGGFLLHAGLSAVLLNVDANLASLDDDARRERAHRERQALQQEADRRYRVLQRADVS